MHRDNKKFLCCVALPCLALPCLALPCLALPCLALPCLALPCLALPCLALPCLALPCLALPCLALPLIYLSLFHFSFCVLNVEAEHLLTEKHRGFVEDAANTAAVEIQKVQSRDRLADRTKEIKKRQQEAKADLEEVRLQTNKLNDSTTL